MNTTVSGHQVQWIGNNHKVVQTDVRLEASQQAGVWLVDGTNDRNTAGDDGHPFRMIIGVRTPEDAARAYVGHGKSLGHALPAVIRVFPLTSLEPIALSGVVDEDGDEEWSAFSDAWVEIRL